MPGLSKNCFVSKTQACEDVKEAYISFTELIESRGMAPLQIYSLTSSSHGYGIKIYIIRESKLITVRK